LRLTLLNSKNLKSHLEINISDQLWNLISSSPNTKQEHEPWPYVFSGYSAWFSLTRIVDRVGWD
jgi:hypothetical protein